MEILLVRHGLPHTVEASKEGADPSLDEEGTRQASLLAACLARGEYGAITAIVSSSMLRSLETAAPFAALSGLPVTVDSRLIEFDAGTKDYGKVMTRYASRAELWNSINEGKWGDLRFDPAAFVARILEGIEEAIAANPDGVVAIFCHGGVIGAYLAHVLGMPRHFFFSPEYSSVSRFLALPDGYRELISVNETRHLPRPR